VIVYCANTTAFHMPDWEFSEGGRWVKLGCKMGRRMKKIENHCFRCLLRLNHKKTLDLI